MRTTIKTTLEELLAEKLTNFPIFSLKTYKMKLDEKFFPSSAQSRMKNFSDFPFEKLPKGHARRDENYRTKMSFSKIIHSVLLFQQ